MNTVWQASGSRTEPREGMPSQYTFHLGLPGGHQHRVDPNVPIEDVAGAVGELGTPWPAANL